MVRGQGAEDAGDKIGSASRRRAFADWWRDWRVQHSFALGLTVLTFLFVAALAIPRAIVTVPSGHVAALWKRFEGGTVTNMHLDEGFHLIFPWDRAFIYDARLRTIVRDYDTISSNGLSMKVQIATRYRINRNSVGALQKQIGPNYPDILLNPEIGANAREVISRYTPEQLYSESRSFIQAQILEQMVTQLGSSLISQSPAGQLIYVEDALIRSVELPQSVAEAIERKSQQYHLVLEYEFRVQREELERQRKIIEAQGIRDFQDIVSDTITDEYLRLRGIDATLGLATSRNAKMVVVGGADGLPLILNTGEFDGQAPGTDGDGSTEDDSTALEEISAPSAHNAAMTEVVPTNSVQPDAHRLQPSAAAATTTTAMQKTGTEQELPDLPPTETPTTLHTEGAGSTISLTDMFAPAPSPQPTPSVPPGAANTTGTGGQMPKP